MRPHPLGTPGSGSPKAPIEIAEVVAYCLAAFPGVVQDRNWGERALFYNPDGRHPVYGWMSWIAIVDPGRRRSSAGPRKKRELGFEELAGTGRTRATTTRGRRPWCCARRSRRRC